MTTPNESAAILQLREALEEIAGSKNLTGTAAQFVRYLQRTATEALAVSPQPAPSPILTDERITAIAAPFDHNGIDGEGGYFQALDFGRAIEADTRVALAVMPGKGVPVDMVLHCPSCGLQHIDAPDDRTTEWINPPHRSHLCHGCGHIWRPADVATNGVATINTKGKNDSPTAQPSPVSAAPVTVDHNAQKAMFKAFSECLMNGDKMLPQDIANKLLAAAPSQQSADKLAEGKS